MKTKKLQSLAAFKPFELKGNLNVKHSGGADYWRATRLSSGGPDEQLMSQVVGTPSHITDGPKYAC